MNYGLNFACRVEERTSALIAGRGTDSGNVAQRSDDELYKQAFNATIAADQGKTMAGGNVLLGEIILLVDCDTRVVGVSNTSCHHYTKY
jgi:hypothetical protein